MSARKWKLEISFELFGNETRGTSLKMLRCGSATGTVLLTQLPQLRHHGGMGQGETVYQVMVDPAQRAACFAELADRPQRIVRGFADPGAAREVLDGESVGCLIIAVDGLAAAPIADLLAAAADFPGVVPMLLADRPETAVVAALLRAGPAEILPRATSAAMLAERVAAAMPVALARGALWRERQAASAALARLSLRERDVLTAMVDGQTSKDIARRLAVSPRTVEVHRASIMRRTGADSLAALLRLCFLNDPRIAVISSKAA